MPLFSAMFRDLATLDRWHREALTPEQRITEDRSRRRQAIEDFATGVPVALIILCVWIAPWFVGAATIIKAAIYLCS